MSCSYVRFCTTIRFVDHQTEVSRRADISPPVRSIGVFRTLTVTSALESRSGLDAAWCWRRGGQGIKRGGVLCGGLPSMQVIEMAAPTAESGFARRRPCSDENRHYPRGGRLSRAQPARTGQAAGPRAALPNDPAARSPSTQLRVGCIRGRLYAACRANPSKH